MLKEDKKMSQDFSEIMSKRSDAELIEIVKKFRDQYQPEAIEAAETELKKRDLTPDKIEAAKQEIKQKEDNIKNKADEPLGIGWKILAFISVFLGIFPVILSFLIASRIKGEGYERKCKEVRLWTFYGIVLFILFGLLIIFTT